MEPVAQGYWEVTVLPSPPSAQRTSAAHPQACVEMPPGTAGAPGVSTTDLVSCTC